MPIVRTAKNCDFTKIPNHILQDRALSWKAKGLLAFLLSRPNNWRFYLTEIERHSTDGRASLQAGIKELIAAGYIARSERREAGKFAGHDYIIADTPQQKNRSGKPAAGKPQRENRSGKPATTKIDLNKIDLNKIDRNKEGGASNIPFSQIVDLFHENCPELPRVIKVTDARRKAIEARWMDCGDLEAWATYFKTAGESDFLNGKVKDFKATFDWLLNQNNMAKVLEGNYTNRKAMDPVARTIQRLMEMDRAEQSGEEIKRGWQ